MAEASASNHLHSCPRRPLMNAHVLQILLLLHNALHHLLCHILHGRQHGLDVVVVKSRAQDTFLSLPLFPRHLEDRLAEQWLHCDAHVHLLVRLLLVEHDLANTLWIPRVHHVHAHKVRLHRLHCSRVRISGLKSVPQVEREHLSPEVCSTEERRQSLDEAHQWVRVGQVLRLGRVTVHSAGVLVLLSDVQIDKEDGPHHRHHRSIDVVQHVVFLLSLLTSEQLRRSSFLLFQQSLQLQCSAHLAHQHHLQRVHVPLCDWLRSSGSRPSII
mmetsp:Transcript_21905/g.85835  ORF Transcript_21905/g.85835 Transcript_21905/m.85835 type:complete len:271 (-) Transcript_21905:148-960(-)